MGQGGFAILGAVVLVTAVATLFSSFQDKERLGEVEVHYDKVKGPQHGDRTQPGGDLLGISFAGVVQKNRETLNKAPRWMDSDEVYEKSFFHYGLPPFARPWINLDVGQDPTIPDVLGYLAVQISRSQEVSYLEIGVSVGKCLFQQLHLLNRDANITALDLESINPSFEKTLTHKESLGTWPGKGKRKERSVTRYNRGTQFPRLHYVATDEYDAGGWDSLNELGIGPFNAIYSDALHTPNALRFEWESIKSRDLLTFQEDEPWFMAWDDLGEAAMRRVVRDIMSECQQIMAVDGKSMQFQAVFIRVNGWLGKNENPHVMGIMSNLDLEALVAEAGLKKVVDPPPTQP